MNDLQYKFATQEDVSLLAKLNQQLILDEGHHNNMTLSQLKERMSGRIEVLVGNPEGISFWKAVGFKDYCITMEMANHLT